MKSMSLAALFVSAVCADLAAAQAPMIVQRPEPDAWSDLVTMRTPEGLYAAPVHATLLPNGEIVFLGYAKTTEGPGGEASRYAWKLTPTPMDQAAPPEVVVFEEEVPYDADPWIDPPAYIQDDLFCSGHTLDMHGRLFTVGGSRYALDLDSGEFSLVGLPYATRFDGSTWERMPFDTVATGLLGTPGRWYGTATRLWDGRILAMAGEDLVMPFPLPNLTAEVFDPATETWDVVASYGGVPIDAWNPDYAHTFVLPTPIGAWDLCVMGGTSKPVFLGLGQPGEDAAWQVHPAARPGAASDLPNSGASSAMLPIRASDGEWGYSNGSILVAGGDHMTPVQGSADVFDPIAGAWIASASLPIPRHHPTTVLLPDGRLLLAAGHIMTGQPQVQHATLIDPAKGFQVKHGAANSGETRGYHAVSLLLPDGRVLVGGGQGTFTASEPSAEKPNFRYYLPSYLSKPRPVIATAPPSLPEDGWFALSALGPKPAEVALVSLGSMTHSFDANQRWIQLETSAVTSIGGLHTLLAKSPTSNRVAPPGHYMLVVLDEARTPSEARIVQVP